MNAKKTIKRQHAKKAKNAIKTPKSSRRTVKTGRGNRRTDARNIKKKKTVAKREIKKPIRKTQNKKTRPTAKKNGANARVSEDSVEKRMERFSSENIESELSGRRRRVNVNVPDQASVKTALGAFFDNEKAVEYLKKNVSKRAVDVVGMLNTPKTDEYIAAQLDMKINAIRRILNIMQGYGLTNYYISKNTNGWLSFSWYINTAKVPAFLNYIDSIGNDKPLVTDSCNDYFICNKCYKEEKFIFTFDDAYDVGFRCNCGNSLSRIEKTEVPGYEQDNRNTAGNPP